MKPYAAGVIALRGTSAAFTAEPQWSLEAFGGAMYSARSSLRAEQREEPDAVYFYPTNCSMSRAISAAVVRSE